MKSRILVALAALTVLLTAVASAPAHNRRHGDRWQAKPTFLDRIDLPNGFRPEGIASGKGTTFYVGSIPTGAVNVGDFTRNGTKPLVPGQTGRAAIGLKFHHGRLFVAGGRTGKAFVYDAATGADVKTFELATGDAPTFINDVVVARGTAWFTDSRRPVLYAVDTDLGSARTLPLTGITFGEGNNLNGIVAAKDRGWHWRGADKGRHDDDKRGDHSKGDDRRSHGDDDHARGHHKRGHRARASHRATRARRAAPAVRADQQRRAVEHRPATGNATQIDLGGATLVNGDGMLLAGRTLFVVQNQLNQVAVVKLSRDLLHGKVITTLKNDGFSVPTTIAAVGRHLYAVNARFGTPPGPDVPVLGHEGLLGRKPGKDVVDAPADAGASVVRFRPAGEVPPRRGQPKITTVRAHPKRAMHPHVRLRNDRGMPIHTTRTSDKSEHVTRAVSESVLASYQLALGHPAPKEQFPQVPVDPDVVEQMIRAELLLDGNARLNLATFVTTWMEPQADALMAETFDKNMIDKDEYPQTAELERRCVAMLGDLWHAPSSGVGCSTTGSSEACMLGALALKRRWQKRRRDAGEASDKPNLILGINAQICWDKFCNFFEVEPRFVTMEGERFILGVEEAVALCDENTIGVVAILGSTFDGAYEPVAELPTRSTTCRSAPASTSRSMSTAPRARWSRRSSTRR